MDETSGPMEAAKGVAEGVKGKLKEVAGAVTGRDDLTDEGRAQQAKAEDQRRAGEYEAKAEEKRARAKVEEVGQKAAQRR